MSIAQSWAPRLASTLREDHMVRYGVANSRQVRATRDQHTMVSPPSIARGCALGAMPGVVGLAFTAIFAGSESAERQATVWLLFGAIGGALGALTTLPLAHLRRRRRELPANNKRYSMMTGLLVGIVPGLNGLVFTAIFVQCGDLEPRARVLTACDTMLTVFLLVFASLLVFGGLLGAMTGWLLALRPTRPA